MFGNAGALGKHLTSHRDGAFSLSLAERLATNPRATRAPKQKKNKADEETKEDEDGEEEEGGGDQLKSAKGKPATRKAMPKPKPKPKARPKRKCAVSNSAEDDKETKKKAKTVKKTKEKAKTEQERDDEHQRLRDQVDLLQQKLAEQQQRQQQAAQNDGAFMTPPGFANTRPFSAAQAALQQPFGRRGQLVFSPFPEGPSAFPRVVDPSSVAMQMSAQPPNIFGGYTFRGPPTAFGGGYPPYPVNGYYGAPGVYMFEQ